VTVLVEKALRWEVLVNEGEGGIGCIDIGTARSCGIVDSGLEVTETLRSTNCPEVAE